MLPPPPEDYSKRFPRYEEAPELVSIGPDHFDREAFLEPRTAAAWAEMREQAKREGRMLLLVSAFRSVVYQQGIIERKLARGQQLAEILKVSAYPGFSEHHTGQAIDIGSPGCCELEESFEATQEFAWLQANAARFGFRMSFPRGHPSGLTYEPWHWCWHPE